MHPTSPRRDVPGTWEECHAVRGDNHTYHHGSHLDAAAFRVWPPVALGVPLADGIGLSLVAVEPIPWPDVRHGVALLLGAAFALWNGWSLVLFHRHATGLLPGQPTTELLRQGAFARSRNPLYVGLMVLYVAIALAVPSVWALLLLPVGFVALLKGSVEPEETYLGQEFGPAYEEYCRRVPRWF